MRVFHIFIYLAVFWCSAAWSSEQPSDESLRAILYFAREEQTSLTKSNDTLLAALTGVKTNFLALGEGGLTALKITRDRYLDMIRSAIKDSEISVFSVDPDGEPRELLFFCVPCDVGFVARVTKAGGQSKLAAFGLFSGSLLRREAADASHLMPFWAKESADQYATTIHRTLIESSLGNILAVLHEDQARAFTYSGKLWHDFDVALFRLVYVYGKNNQGDAYSQSAKDYLQCLRSITEGEQLTKCYNGSIEPIYSSFERTLDDKAKNGALLEHLRNSELGPQVKLSNMKLMFFGPALKDGITTILVEASDKPAHVIIAAY